MEYFGHSKVTSGKRQEMNSVERPTPANLQELEVYILYSYFIGAAKGKCVFCLSLEAEFHCMGQRRLSKRSMVRMEERCKMQHAACVFKIVSAEVYNREIL